MTNKKKDYESIISKELDEMLEQNPGLEKKPNNRSSGIVLCMPLTYLSF